MKSVLIGKIGEDLAQEYLRSKGYKIIDRNYKTKYGEIDLVAYKDNTLIFVEVRSRTGENFGSPEETINKRKRSKVYNNAIAYVNIKKWKKEYRVDAICIVLNKDKTIQRLNYYKNI